VTAYAPPPPPPPALAGPFTRSVRPHTQLVA
jgi:hypothetical protein